MRLPIEPIPASPPSEDLYEVRELTPLTPAPFVRARNLPPMIVPRRQQRREPLPREQQTASEPSTPIGEERRRADRRVAQVPVLLDTRTGRDRRQAGGTGGSGIDIEV